MQSCFVESNGIRLHYLDFPAIEHAEETLIISHGLTANAYCMGGVIKAGLNRRMRVLAVDLRGRGLSDKPQTGYSMADHAADVVGLMDALGIEQCIIGGHSFGGLVTIYLGAHYPERMKKAIIIDSGLLHPDVRELIKPSLERLERTLPSVETYIEALKQSPYYAFNHFWNDELEAYYRADVEELSDGTVRSRSRPHAIAEAVDKALGEDWPIIMQQMNRLALLMRAPDGFGPPGTPPIVPETEAADTVNALPNCKLVTLTGHHITMLFGDHASGVVQSIEDFVFA